MSRSRRARRYVLDDPPTISSVADTTVYKCFARWYDQGIWDQMRTHFVAGPDREPLILDSTGVRA